MIEVVVTFTEDKENTPKAVPKYHYEIKQGRYGSGLQDSGIYGRIMQYTENHALAAEVIGWAELAGVGEVYESDELTAEIVEV